MIEQRYVEIPPGVLFDEHLGDGAFRAYAVLATFARGTDGEPFELTAEALGSLLYCSAKTANRYLRQLHGRRWIVHEWRPGRRSLITVLEPS